METVTATATQTQRKQLDTSSQLHALVDSLGYDGRMLFGAAIGRASLCNIVARARHA